MPIGADNSRLLTSCDAIGSAVVRQLWGKFARLGQHKNLKDLDGGKDALSMP